MRIIAPEKRENQKSYFYRRGSCPHVLGALSVGRIAVGGDIIGLSRGPIISYICDIGTAVFYDEVRVFRPFECEHILIAARRLFLVYDDFCRPQFSHSSSGRNI